MNKKEICIVIPIYKETLNVFEIQSVEQCIKVLSDYMIHFVCPVELNVDFYKEKFPEIKSFTFFEMNYFKSIEGYNKLMLSPVFYKAFDGFEYMLVYQTDCYVFRDELLTWANKGYDYIGGVWFEDYHLSPYKGAKVWFAGNGGFSLRKIESLYKLLTSKVPIKKLEDFKIEKEQLKENGEFSSLKWNLFLQFKLLGYQNNMNYISKHYKLNEDVFFMEASTIYKKISIPKVNDALGFSWDKYPKYLLKELKLPLPFACHGWFREDYLYKGNKSFWMVYINNIKNKN